MHPTMQYELMNARVADLHRQAQRDRTAQAAIRSRRAQAHHRARFVLGRAVTAVARVLTLAGGRSPSPTR
jgi:precorrin isomerase